MKYCESTWSHGIQGQTKQRDFFKVLMFGGVGGGQGSCWVPGWNHKDTEDTKSPRQCRGLPFHNLSRALLRTKARDPGGGNPFISLWESEWKQQHAQSDWERAFLYCSNTFQDTIQSLHKSKYKQADITQKEHSHATLMQHQTNLSSTDIWFNQILNQCTVILSCTINDKHVFIVYSSEG